MNSFFIHIILFQFLMGFSFGNNTNYEACEILKEEISHKANKHRLRLFFKSYLSEAQRINNEVPIDSFVNKQKKWFEQSSRVFHDFYPSENKYVFYEDYFDDYIEMNDSLGIYFLFQPIHEITNNIYWSGTSHLNPEPFPSDVSGKSSFYTIQVKKWAFQQIQKDGSLSRNEKPVLIRLNYKLLVDRERDEVKIIGIYKQKNT